MILISIYLGFINDTSSVSLNTELLGKLTNISKYAIASIRNPNAITPVRLYCNVFKNLLNII